MIPRNAVKEMFRSTTLQRIVALALVSMTACVSTCSKSSDPPNIPTSHEPLIDPVTVPAHGAESLSSDLLSYEIMSCEDVPVSKVVFRLRLDFLSGECLPSEDQLAAISRYLKRTHGAFESVWVYFYMRGYDSDLHPPFAGAHHIHGWKMKVEIYARPIPSSKESVRFGLGENQRRQLFSDLIVLDRLSLQWGNDDRLESERLRICTQYGTHKNLYMDITNEGFEKGWAKPRP